VKRLLILVALGVMLAGVLLSRIADTGMCKMKRSSTITLLALVTLLVLCILSPWAGFSVMQAQEGWCCLNGEVFPYSQARCEGRGGSFFATQEEAEERCQAYAPPQDQWWFPRAGAA